VGDELAVFLPEDGADMFCGGFNLLELKSEVVDIRNYTWIDHQATWLGGGEVVGYTSRSPARRDTCSWSSYETFATRRRAPKGIQYTRPRKGLQSRIVRRTSRFSKAPGSTPSQLGGN
jgi:hypothetical protein